MRIKPRYLYVFPFFFSCFLKVNVGAAGEGRGGEYVFQERGELLKSNHRDFGELSPPDQQPTFFGVQHEGIRGILENDEPAEYVKCGHPAKFFDGRLSVFPRLSFSIHIMR
jgi:hypothetical protein